MTFQQVERSIQGCLFANGNFQAIRQVLFSEHPVSWQETALAEARPEAAPARRAKKKWRRRELDLK